MSRVTETVLQCTVSRVTETVLQCTVSRVTENVLQCTVSRLQRMYYSALCLGVTDSTTVHCV